MPSPRFALRPHFPSTTHDSNQHELFPKTRQKETTITNHLETTNINRNLTCHLAMYKIPSVYSHITCFVATLCWLPTPFILSYLFAKAGARKGGMLLFVRYLGRKLCIFFISLTSSSAFPKLWGTFGNVGRPWVAIGESSDCLHFIHVSMHFSSDEEQTRLSCLQSMYECM